MSDPTKTQDKAPTAKPPSTPPPVEKADADGGSKDSPQSVSTLDSPSRKEGATETATKNSLESFKTFVKEWNEENTVETPEANTAIVKKDKREEVDTFESASFNVNKGKGREQDVSESTVKPSVTVPVTKKQKPQLDKGAYTEGYQTALDDIKKGITSSDDATRTSHASKIFKKGKSFNRGYKDAFRESIDHQEWVLAKVGALGTDSDLEEIAAKRPKGEWEGPDYSSEHYRYYLEWLTIPRTDMFKDFPEHHALVRKSTQKLYVAALTKEGALEPQVKFNEDGTVTNNKAQTSSSTLGKRSAANSKAGDSAKTPQCGCTDMNLPLCFPPGTTSRTKPKAKLARASASSSQDSGSKVAPTSTVKVLKPTSQSQDFKSVPGASSTAKSPAILPRTIEASRDSQRPNSTSKPSTNALVRLKLPRIRPRSKSRVRFALPEGVPIVVGPSSAAPATRSAPEPVFPFIDQHGNVRIAPLQEYQKARKEFFRDLDNLSDRHFRRLSDTLEEEVGDWRYDGGSSQRGALESLVQLQHDIQVMIDRISQRPRLNARNSTLEMVIRIRQGGSSHSRRDSGGSSSSHAAKKSKDKTEKRSEREE